MAVRDDVEWFKRNFAAEVNAAIAGTPLTIDLLCAIALQETGYIWHKLVAKGLPNEEVLRLCVGDTIDAPRRSAFPKNKAALIVRPQGQQMFELAHTLLVEMAAATGIADYIHAGNNPVKFCRGYGIFQRDLQFFKEDPEYFLDQAWMYFDRCLGEAVKELKIGLDNRGYSGMSILNDRQLCYVAIVYNTGFGNFREERGLEQGYKDGNGVYYGEHIARYLDISQSVPTPELSLAGGGWASGTTRPLRGAHGRLSVADVAKQELSLYGGIDEGDEPLRSHLDDYWRAANANPDDFTPEDYWSAAFVSYCVRKSGAAQQQFNFHVRHSEFVFAAIQNAETGRGDFRGHPIAEYTPKIGDIIQNNQPEYNYSFSYARTHKQYPSHSAIVVDFDERDGIRYAVTIGGNEGNTVGKKRVPLMSNGLIRQRQNSNYYMSIIENRMVSDGSLHMPGHYIVRARPDLNLRAGPDTAFEVKQTLPNGTELYVIEFVDTERGRWALVDLAGDGGRDGFVFASYIDPA